MVNTKKNSSLVSSANEPRISRKVYSEHIPVNWSEWDLIKDRIARCRVRLDGWVHAASFFGSAFIFAIAYAFSEDWSPISITIVVVSLLLAIVCVLARRSIKHTQGESISTVLEDMKQIEERYQRPPSRRRKDNAEGKGGREQQNESLNKKTIP